MTPKVVQVENEMQIIVFLNCPMQPSAEIVPWCGSFVSKICEDFRIN